MDAHAARLIGAGLATSGMIGAGVGLGVLFGNYLQAAIRNPSAAASFTPAATMRSRLSPGLGPFVGRSRIPQAVSMLAGRPVSSLMASILVPG